MRVLTTLGGRAAILVPLFALGVLFLTPPAALSQSRPATCASGYVWREAFPGDYVCVTPETRRQAADDNAQASARINSTGAYGPDTCISGYVWREASPRDRVCVTPQTRRQAAEDNAQASSRQVTTLRRINPAALDTRGQVMQRQRLDPPPSHTHPTEHATCGDVVTVILNEDGEVEVEIRHTDGVVERKTAAGTTTTYPDGRTEFRPNSFIMAQVQPPNPPVLSTDAQVLQFWREYHAESLLDIFRQLAENDPDAARKLANAEGGMTLYQKINYRTKIIQQFLSRR
jgi:hypothetical protein